MNKISIIGTGSVGSTIAYSLAILGMASEIVMIDINSESQIDTSVTTIIISLIISRLHPQFLQPPLDVFFRRQL